MLPEKNRFAGCFDCGDAHAQDSAVGKHMLHVTDLVYRIGERSLFDKACAHVPAGHRVGLVGANGSGKTTFYVRMNR